MEKFKRFLINLWEWVLEYFGILLFFICLIMAGLGLVLAYSNSLERKEEPKMENPFLNPFTLKNTSIAINESNSLIVFNTTTGEYKVYSDSVGIEIFNLYTNQIFFSNDDPIQ